MTESIKPRKSSGKSLHKANPVRLVLASAVTVIPAREAPPYLDGFPAPHVTAEPREQMNITRKERCAMWTPKDKKTFTHEFVQHGKNFLKISQAFVDKTPEDCIQHYYLTKHAMQYKKLKLKTEPVVKRKTSVNLIMGGKPPQKKRRYASKDK